MSPAGKQLDLLITAGSGYVVGNNAQNRVNGGFGMVNVKAGTSAKLTFTLVDSSTQVPVTLEEFEMTFYDFDGGSKGKALEFATVGGFDHYKVADDTQILVSAESDGRTKFTATESGTGRDNPSDPDALTDLQL